VGVPQSTQSTESPVEQRVGIPGQFSVFIHCWRTIATLAVFLGHATRPDMLFNVDFSLIGRATIPTFLIVSGYFTTMSFAHGGRFLKKVAKRYFNMWVFFVPAAALVLAMDVYLISVDSVILTRDKFDPDLSLARIGADVFDLLTFSGEYWRLHPKGQGVFSNEAFWTMDFIMGYSLLTAALYLLSGWVRIAVSLLICAVVGPTVLLLAPLWFAGVLAYESHRRLLYHRGVTSLGKLRARLRHLGLRVDIRTIKRTGACLVGASVIAWVVFETTSAGPELYAWSKSLAGYEWRQHLGMSKRYLWQWGYVPILFFLFIGTRLMLDSPAPASLVRVVSTLSRYAFPVYAIHFTLLYLVAALIPNYQARYDSPDPYVMMSGAMALSLLFSYSCYRFVKPVTDQWARRLFG
jgi:hypothetical protein